MIGVLLTFKKKNFSTMKNNYLFKKSYGFIFFAMVVYTTLGATNLKEKFPLVLEPSDYAIGTMWTYSSFSEDCNTNEYDKYKIERDTLIGTRQYGVLVKTSRSERRIVGYIFKKDKKIYNWKNGKEYLMYDYGLKVGDSLRYEYPYSTPALKDVKLVLTKIDTQRIMGKDFLRHHVKSLRDGNNICNTVDTLIEEVGSIRDIFPRGCLVFVPGCLPKLLCFQTSGFVLNYNFNCLTPTDDLRNTQVSISPNPVASELTLSGVDREDVKIEMFDLSGRMLFSDDIKNDGSPITLTTTTLKQGMYILKVYDSLSHEKLFISSFIKSN
jgi:hypothetical protein